ncbi:MULTISPECIES: RHS repeat-associated core domain-containing protein [Kitasatospora]|uniref:RHS repeat domain-containing protein n=1 Tax=Kitasatospora TaxID=2063 RepID=UPI0011D2C12A|nr:MULTISPECIES: RHS repeat-associated core domain-containing protein [Kitasatospora]
MSPGGAGRARPWSPFRTRIAVLSALAIAASVLAPTAATAAGSSDRIWSPPGTALPKTKAVGGKAAGKPTQVTPKYQVPSDWAPADGTPADSGASASPSAAARGLAAPMAQPAAAPAGSPGGDGTYTATSLAPSSAWAAGNASGSFTYNYPVEVPAPLAGAAPQVVLGYDSASVDGRTSSTNAQASWIGDGWDYSPGFIERSYQVCDKHGIDNSFDRCWAGDNATLQLGGHSGELVRDDANGSWHLKDDDGTRVEFLTGAANGDDNGEYVKVTDNDGTAYYFGLNHLPGGDRTDPATNSAWTVPVYAPAAGNPCYDSAKGAGSWCNQAWRWNLDYTVDTHGNLTTYNYAAETNYYNRGGAQNGGTGTLTGYTRGGTLTSIAYGQRLADQVAAKGTAKAAATVRFDTAPEGRCSTAGGFTCSGASISTAGAAHWPDVPYDQNCAATGTCTTYSPTFWSNARLASITTRVLSGGSYRNVDTYALSHSFPDPGDGTKPAMWLSGIQRTGKDGTAITLPATTFTPVMLPNRVDGTSLVPAPAPFNRPRVQMVTTETGGQTNIDYNLPSCSRLQGVMPSAADNNTTSCYNVKWYPRGSSADSQPVDDWFNRYTVRSITENDPVTGAPQKVAAYAYGPAAWHRDDSALTDSKTRTWDSFRGFASVTTTTGDGNDGPKTQTRTTYLQGMNGDLRADGSTRGVTVTDSLGESVTDDDWLQGRVLESAVHTQAGGSVTAYTVTRLTDPVITATRARGSGLPALVARYGATRSAITTKSLKADGTWRTTAEVATTDPANGNRPVRQDKTADGQAELCVRTSYATGSDPMVRNLVSEKLTVRGDCSTAPSSGNTLAGSRTLYDGKPYGQAGGAGDATGEQVLDRFDAAGTAQYVTMSVTGYDGYGRVTSTTDPNSTDAQHPAGATTTTAYSAANAGELPDSVAVTSPAPASATGWTSTTTLSPARGLPLATTDQNGRTTTSAYDALGRITAVWLPGQPTTSPANQTFAYAVNGTGAPSSVTTSTLNDNSQYTRVQVEIYDGLGRVRQVQSTPTVSAYQGRLITDTYFDSHGWAAKTNAAWYNDAAAPGTALYTAADAVIPAQTRTVFDGQGRPTASAFYSLNQEQWRTTTSYPGADRTDVTPPQGGTPTSTVTDAKGRTVQTWQYRTPTATGRESDADVTTVGYDDAGNTVSHTDAGGKNTWSYGYDLRGRQTSVNDPDAGKSTYTYTAGNQVRTVTDARGITTSRDYDLIGRQTGLYEGADTTDPSKQLAAWTFDTVAGGKGRPSSATRYVGGAAGDAYSTQVYGYDNAYRPTGTTWSVPGREVGQTAPFTYTSRSAYNTVTGSLKSTLTPAVADRAAETISYTYDVNGAMLKFGTSSTVYDMGTNYDAYGRPVRTTVNPWGTQIVSTVNYDEATGRVVSHFVDKQTSATGAVQQSTLTYDASGKVTSVKDVADNAPAGTDLQCFGYDYLGRLTTAWSDTGTTTTKPQPAVPGQGACTNASPTSGAVAPAGTTVGGPAAYWQSYTYDTTGNRTALVKHDTGGNGAADVTVTQSFPAAGSTNTPTGTPVPGSGSGGPHALLGSTATGAGNPGPTSYRYDAAGNTTSITTAAGTSDLAWNAEGKLSTLTGAAGSTGYVYDANGNLLVRHSPGRTTLFLGSDELGYDTAGKTLSDVRSYPLPNGLTAVRSGTAMVFQVADRHGTNGLAIDATTLAETRRATDPFGNPRGTQPTGWTGTRGFVGGTADAATGLTTLGAREYQPATGRFVSTDPVLDPDDPQQWNGYAYGDNNPVNLSDPTGLRPDGQYGGFSSLMPDGLTETWAPDNNGGWNWSRKYALGAPGKGVTQWVTQTVNFNNKKPSADRTTFVNQKFRPNATWSSVLHVGAELSGVNDLRDCSKGSVSSCGWAAMSIVPFGKVGKAVKIAEEGAEAARAAHAAEDANHVVPKKGKEVVKGAENVARDMLDPESMRGATWDEALELAKGDGWILEDAPRATGGGFILRKGNPFILIEKGDKGARSLDHQGPYIKYQFGSKAVRIPLQGNPALKQ